MSGGSKSWIKSCAIGCGVLALIPLLAVGLISLTTWLSVRSANRASAELEARFGAPESFTPATDGSVPAARIEAFLEARQALSDLCGRFEEAQAQVERIAVLDDKEEPTGRDIADAFGGITEVAGGIAPLVGKLFKQRNRALVEAEMGLGEYAYIFAVAYRAQLLDASLEEQLFAEEGPVAAEARGLLLATLSNQRDAMIAQARMEYELQTLVREIGSMEQDPRRLPWRDGLPAPIATSLAAHRIRLDEAYCEATAGIDMDPASGRALRIAVE